MIKVSKPLCIARFTGYEFKKKSVLNSGVTLEMLNKEYSKIRNKNKAKIMKAQKKY